VKETIKFIFLFFKQKDNQKLYVKKSFNKKKKLLWPIEIRFSNFKRIIYLLIFRKNKNFLSLLQCKANSFSKERVCKRNEILYFFFRKNEGMKFFILSKDKMKE